MKALRFAAATFLALLLAAVALAEFWVPAHYATQDRETFAAPPSRLHPLGTDGLGRDRLSRLVYGTRISLILAPTAALISCMLAALLGSAAALGGSVTGAVILALADLFLSLPWLFLLLTVRAFLPLNVSPVASVTITFVLLAVLGWAGPARVIGAAVRKLRDSEYTVHAAAAGIGARRELWRQIIPNVLPVLLAQFWVAVPVYVLAEATLGMLGLGVSEPLPSWGTLLHEIEAGSIAAEPWLLAPVILLTVVIGSVQLLARRKNSGTGEEYA